MFKECIIWLKGKPIAKYIVYITLSTRWKICKSLIFIFHNYILEKKNRKIRLDSFKIYATVVMKYFVKITQTLQEKFSYLEFFESVFSHVRTEYGEILRTFPCSVQIRENTDQKNSKYGHFTRREKPGVEVAESCVILHYLKHPKMNISQGNLINYTHSDYRGGYMNIIFNLSWVKLSLCPI